MIKTIPIKQNNKICNYSEVNICKNKYDWDKSVPVKSLRDFLFQQFIIDFPLCKYNIIFLLNHYLLLIPYMNAQERMELTGFSSYKEIPMEFRNYCTGCWCCCSKRIDENHEWLYYVEKN